jgi:hypothetical protein
MLAVMNVSQRIVIKAANLECSKQAFWKTIEQFTLLTMLF